MSLVLPSQWSIAASKVAMTLVAEGRPCAALSPFVERYLLVEHRADRFDTHLPDIRPVASFSLRGDCIIDGRERAPLSGMTGPYQRVRSHHHSNGHSVVLVFFTPGGAASLLRGPMEELAGTTMGLGEFLRRSSELGRLEENLRRPDGGESPFAAVQDFLMEHLGNAQRDVTVTAAIDWLERRMGQGRISDLAHHIGLSQSALERRFRRTIGLPPKKVAAIVRLRAAIGSLSKHRDLAALAQEAGYFDQAHLSNEIRRATGVSPHRLRVSRNTSADAEFLQSLATR